jgi:hypothetical protein
MRGRSAYATLVLLLGLGAGPARADQEEMDAHTRHPVHTVLLGNLGILPDTTTMDKGDSLVFENHAIQPIKVTFTDPKDQRDKIRCGLIKGRATEESRAPWQLFSWDDGRLVATVPPGRFASVCSLQPGTYSIVASRLGAGVGAPGASGDMPKAQIIVK